MDTVYKPDNHIKYLLHSHTALSGAVFGVRAQIQQEQQQVLPLQRSLEVGQS